MAHTCKVCGISVTGNGMQNRATTCDACIQRGFKWCHGCNTILPIDSFGKNGSTIRAMCKKCVSTKKADDERNKRNNDLVYAENKRVYYREHDRQRYQTDTSYRIRKLTAKHKRRGVDSTAMKLSEADWLVVCDKFNNSCAYCGSTSTLTIEHIIAVNNGGSNDASNIIPACEHCNKSKGSKELVSWYIQQSFFTIERLNAVLSHLKGGI